MANPAFQLNNLDPIIEAANALETVINAPIPPHLIHLQVFEHLYYNYTNLFRSRFKICLETGEEAEVPLIAMLLTSFLLAYYLIKALSECLKSLKKMGP